MPSDHRRFAACAGAVGWAALGLQLLLTIQLAVASGKGALGGLWIYLGYFTVLTNLFAALALTVIARRRRDGFRSLFARPDVHAAIAMSITVVAVIYHLLLRQLWHPQGWQFVADQALHTLLPLLFVLHWWLAVPKASLRWQQVLVWQAYPAGYLIYALARGALNGWYPYPFVDVATLGYPRVLVNATGVLLVFVAAGLLLVALARCQNRRSTAAADNASRSH